MSALVHAHWLSHILRSHRGHLFYLLIDPLKEYFPFFLKALLTSIEQPSDYLCVFKLHFGLFVICSFDLNHVNLIDLLFYLFDFLVKPLLVWCDHCRLIMAFESCRFFKEMDH